MTPPGKPPSRPGRHQTHTERDFEGLAARRERESAAPARDVDLEDLTDRHAAAEIDEDELAELRALREPDDRLGKLERKHDKLEATVTETRVDIGHIKGSVETIKDLAVRAEQERDARHKREAEERASWWRNLPLVIKALGVAIAAIITAAIYGAAH